MGEARQRKRAHEKLLAEQPWCVYCGGATWADTVDHIPPIAMFTRRQRPKGLEVSACGLCNHGTKWADQLASFVGRIYPDATTSDEDQDFTQTLIGVQNNFPGLLQKMLPTPELRDRLVRKIGHLGGRHPLNLDLPEIQDAMYVFGAKMGFALHYHVASNILPPGGAVAVRWFTNVSAIAGEIPRSIFELFNSPQTLRQGRKEVSEQFQYESKVTPDRTFALHWSTFRRAVAIASTSVTDATRFDAFGESVVVRVFRPGEFRTLNPARPRL